MLIKSLASFRTTKVVPQEELKAAFFLPTVPIVMPFCCIVFGSSIACILLFRSD